MNKNLVVISLGGSLVVPAHGIDIEFLKSFQKIILREVKRGQRFILIVGGGSTARAYMHAARDVSPVTHDDMDWLGIHATRLNGHLLRTVFRSIAHPKMLKDPTRKSSWKEGVLIAAGWKPGWSTDYVAVRFAQLYNATTVVNLSNITQVHDQDPSKSKHAKPIDNISWKNFRKLIGKKWSPGSNAPFDPIASILAERLEMKVIVAKGHDLKNLQRILDGQSFIGTTIS
ncbi:UMP kinase [Candidatus Uhrbacteria bacterium]|nr:UMP kinase [Candidatus Uhrbacteria bacterium]